MHLHGHSVVKAIAALPIYKKLVQLQPDDPPGHRYCLMCCVTESGNLLAVQLLLNQHPEKFPTATWAYTQALSLYGLEGNGTRSDEALHMAIQINRHVPALLLKGDDELLRLSLRQCNGGDKWEAQRYYQMGAKAWRKTSGALEWLRQQVEKSRLFRSQKGSDPQARKG